MQELPLCVLARIVRRVATSDTAAATALAQTCRLLAAVCADDLLVFAPLCRELAKESGAGVCVAAYCGAGVSSLTRPHASVFRALRLGAFLTGSLWRGVGDEDDRLFLFFWRSDDGRGTVELTELFADDCTATRVHTCRTVGCGDALSEARGRALHDVLRLDADRCVLRPVPLDPVVSDVARAIGECASPVGSLPSPVGSPCADFAASFLSFSSSILRSKSRRRGGLQKGDTTTVLLRVSGVEQLSLTTAAEAEDAALLVAGVTGVRCSVHASCTRHLYWLRGGRLQARCSHDGLLQNVERIAC